MDDGASEERTGTRTIIATLGKGGDGVPSSVTATFLFCDLVGSTALLTRIGDDANDDVRRQCFGVFREAVAQYRGIEVKTLGDGMLALFWNSVSDGIGCGTATQRGIARLDNESPLLGLGLRVRLEGVTQPAQCGATATWNGQSCASKLRALLKDEVPASP